VIAPSRKGRRTGEFAIKAANIRDTVYAFPTCAADIKSMV
jgi:hypothetical protein